MASSVQTASSSGTPVGLYAQSLTLGSGGLSVAGPVELSSVATTSITADKIYLPNSSGNGTVITENLSGTFEGNYSFSQVQAGTWSPSINYWSNGVFSAGQVVVFGSNTSAPGVYPNNLYTLKTQPPGSAPYPTPPTVGSGWALTSSNALVDGGYPALDAAGSFQAINVSIQGLSTNKMDFMGGGGASNAIAANPSGMTLLQNSPLSNTGARLQIAGTVETDGIVIQQAGSVYSPSCSATLDGAGVRTQFRLGYDYTWTAGSTGYTWVETPTTLGLGASRITGNAIDGAAAVFLSRELDLGSVAGILTVYSKSSTDFVVVSVNASNVSGINDTAFFEWLIINPNWA